MKTIRYLLSAIALLLGSLNANATLMTFDDIGAQNKWDTVLSSYLGFNFTNSWVTDLVVNSSSPGAVSGDFGLYFDRGPFVSMTSANQLDFTFDGLYVKKHTFYSGNGPESGTISGFNNNVRMWTISTVIVQSGYGVYQYIGGRTTAIDRLEIDLGGYYFVDNISLNNPFIPVAPTIPDPVAPPLVTPVVASIPEPACLTILGIGVIGFGVFKRRTNPAMAASLSN